MIVTLEGNIDDDARDMLALVRKLEPIHEDRTDRRWQLRCGSVNYLGPWAVSVIAAAFLRGRQLGQRPRIVLPTEPPPLQAFCVFSGMQQMFRKGAAPNPEHPECETVPIEVFESASWDRSNRIIALLRRHTDLDEEREEQIRTCVQEIIQNIVDHAASPIGGVMCARYMAASKEVRVAIVDRGVGIAASLRERFPEIRTSELALRLVIEGGYSSLSRPNNMGQGINLLFDLVASAGGRIAIFTGDAHAWVGHGAGPRILADACVFHWTGAFFALPVGG